MPYFPLFVDLSRSSVLVVGAGNVASRKIEKLLPYCGRIRVVAKRASDEVRQWAAEGRISFEEREFRDADLEGARLVIVGADDLDLQRRVFGLCAERSIPCNCVDSPDYCSFIFPALVERGNVVVGISTGGKAPGLSKLLRRKIDAFLPGNLERIAQQAAELRRDAVQKSLPTYDERAARMEEALERLWSRELRASFWTAVRKVFR